MGLFALREKTDRKGNLKGFDIASIADSGLDKAVEGLPEGRYTVVGQDTPLTPVEVTYVTKQVNIVG